MGVFCIRAFIFHLTRQGRERPLSAGERSSVVVEAAGWPGAVAALPEYLSVSLYMPVAIGTYPNKSIITNLVILDA